MRLGGRAPQTRGLGRVLKIYCAGDAVVQKYPINYDPTVLSENLVMRGKFVPVEEWLQTNVPGWEALNEDEKCALRDFPILWSYFEGWVTHPHTANAQSIETAIDEISEVSFSDIVATDRAFEHYKQRFFPDGLEAELFGKIGLNGIWGAFVRGTLLDEDPKAPQRAKAVLMIINRLRNNFLHCLMAQYPMSCSQSPSRPPVLSHHRHHLHR
jgi:hypothetical protein